VLNPFTAGPGFNAVEVDYEPKSVLLAFLDLAEPAVPVVPDSPIIPIFNRVERRLKSERTANIL